MYPDPILVHTALTMLGLLKALIQTHPWLLVGVVAMLVSWCLPDL